MDLDAQAVEVTKLSLCLKMLEGEIAQTLGVSGWIRNCYDGSVEAQLEGEAEAVDELVELLGEGPPGARVDRVEVEEADSEGLSGFEVLH